MSPFDKARYARLLEGLEVTERNFLELERTWRMDAEFFQQRHLAIEAKLTTARYSTVADVASISDGNHFSISESFAEEGIPYYRGQDVVGHFFVEQASPNRITRKAFEKSFMRRSHLKQGDVLLSIIGTVGETSLVKTEQEATCSCKLAILRPKDIEPAYLATFLSSAVGRALTERWKRGAVQTGLLLEDMDQLPVPRFGKVFEEKIAAVVSDAYEAQSANEQAAEEAKILLISALGLERWQAPEPLSYVRNSSEAFATGRLDAEYQQPKYAALHTELASRFVIEQLSSLGVVTKGVTVQYFEDGGIPIIRSGDIGNIENDDTFLRSHPTERVFLLEKGDVLISSIGFGSIGKVQVFDKEGHFGTVSEVTVIRQKKINPYYLAAFFRSEAGQMQIERYITGATGQLHLYPRDVSKFWIPVLPEVQQAEFEEMARRALATRKKAAQLLDNAKRAVEIAIEDSESAALAYLKSQGVKP